MSLIITDNNLGIEVKNANVKIGYFTINRNGKSQAGYPLFSANLYLEYSNASGIYFRKCITLDNLLEEMCNFAYFYGAMKVTIEEFQEAEDNIPVYIAPAIVEEVEIPPMEEIKEETITETIPTETPSETPSETPTV